MFFFHKLVFSVLVVNFLLFILCVTLKCSNTGCSLVVIIDGDNDSKFTGSQCAS